MSTRRAFLGRLARGVATLYVAPGALEALASSAPVQAAHLEERRFEELTRLMQDIYLKQILRGIPTRSPILQLFSNPGPTTPTEKAFLFPVAVQRQP